MESNTQVVTFITYVFFMYLILAIAIERTIEILISVYNYTEFKHGWERWWNGIAEKLRKRYDRMSAYRSADSPGKNNLINRLLWKVITEKPYEGGKEVISADLIRLQYIRVGARVAAIALAAVLVAALQLDFIAVVELAMPDAAKLAPVTDYASVRFILTAVALSIGSEPLHQIISKIEKRAAGKK